MKFEGRNAVFELLNSNKTIEKIQVLDKTTDAKLREMVAIAQEKGVRVDWVNKPTLDKLSETGHHQGIIAFVTDFVYSTLEDVLCKSVGQNNQLFIMLDGVLDPHNLGSVIRIADCFSAVAVIIPKNRSASVNETVVRVSAGASAYVDVVKVTNLVSTIKKLKECGVWVYTADMDGEEARNMNLNGNVCIVVGGEGEGVSTLVRKESDGIIKIPMSGHVNSLNASVSCGIVCYEIRRQQSK